MAPSPAPARRNIAERIARTLRASIVKGRLQPGEALPSERVLAEKYDVNRSSVREAMKRLEGWGLVTIRQGGATRVAEVLLDAGMSLLPELLEAGGTLHHSKLLAPFGLDASRPEFWHLGLNVIEGMIDELERLDPAA